MCLLVFVTYSFLFSFFECLHAFAPPHWLMSVIVFAFNMFPRFQNIFVLSHFLFPFVSWSLWIWSCLLLSLVVLAHSHLLFPKCRSAFAPLPFSVHSFPTFTLRRSLPFQCLATFVQTLILNYSTSQVFVWSFCQRPIIDPFYFILLFGPRGVLLSLLKRY